MSETVRDEKLETSTTVRSVSTTATAEMQQFTAKIVDMMKQEKLYASQGGPIILSQIENEYGNIDSAYGPAAKTYINWAATMALSLDTGVPCASKQILLIPLSTPAVGSIVTISPQILIRNQKCGQRIGVDGSSRPHGVDKNTDTSSKLSAASVFKLPVSLVYVTKLITEELIIQSIMVQDIMIQLHSINNINHQEIMRWLGSYSLSRIAAEGVQCFSCGEVGHRQTEYRKMRKKPVLFNEMDDSGEEDAEIGEEAQFEEEDGESNIRAAYLMKRRKSKKKMWKLVKNLSLTK
ncbi:hypothetical protein LWI28_023898 [Acer negundo]|uniref:beta-galactosidase n=1 Tax=Acer negundo TaxID=4023 RepID=A0AAD5NKI6_ACENE|nr:hypothetical protein LWI28_023898 [Acer negundo]